MTIQPAKIILGSRSPRRRELLSSMVGDDTIVILPPSSPDEPGFDDVSDEAGIERRLTNIVQMKHDDICRQLASMANEGAQFTESHLPFIVVADTIVIASDDSGMRTVLGQPGPERWQDDVRSWFRKWLSGRTHEVWTGVMVSRGNQRTQFIVRSKVTFCDVSNELLEWYVSTGESTGKAGGYAIQSHAALFVTRFEGSLTGIIGLPLMEVVEGLTQLGWRSEAS